MPFYDFCGFCSVAVKSVYKLQFFVCKCTNLKHVNSTSTSCIVITICVVSVMELYVYSVQEDWLWSGVSATASQRYLRLLLRIVTFYNLSPAAAVSHRLRDISCSVRFERHFMSAMIWNDMIWSPRLSSITAHRAILKYTDTALRAL